MRKQEIMKKLVAVSLVSLVAGLQAMAADLSDGSAVVSDLGVMAVQAKTALGKAAAGGDLIAISKAQAKSDALADALKEAKELFAKMETAVSNEDEAAVNKLYADMEKVKNDALNPPAPKEQVAVKKKKTSGGKGAVVPNIHENLGNTVAQQQIHQTIVDIATANGGAKPVLPNSPVTPY